MPDAACAGAPVVCTAQIERQHAPRLSARGQLVNEGGQHADLGGRALKAAVHLAADAVPDDRQVGW